MRYLFAFIFCLFFSVSFAQKSAKDVAIRYITKAMQEQETCWNKGDITCFMAHYWKSDSLRFIGSSGLTYGWKETLDNYKKSYPDKEEMGKLEFTNLSLEFIDDNTILVIGRWRLVREEKLKNLEGSYSLLWKQKNGSWVIVLDHSS